MLALVLGWSAAVLAQSSELPRCQPGMTDYLSIRAEGCWFTAARGRWRIVDHKSHYDSIVFELEVSSVDVSPEVTRRILERLGQRYADMVIYLQEASTAGQSRTRRVTWNRGRGPEQLEFLRNTRRPAR